MEEFVRHYLKLKAFLTVVDCKDEEVSLQLHKLKAESLIQSEFLKELYVNHESLHEFRKDLLKLIYKTLKDIEDLDELDNFTQYLESVRHMAEL